MKKDFILYQHKTCTETDCPYIIIIQEGRVLKCSSCDKGKIYPKIEFCRKKNILFYYFGRVNRYDLDGVFDCIDYYMIEEIYCCVEIYYPDGKKNLFNELKNTALLNKVKPYTYFHNNKYCYRSILNLDDFSIFENMCILSSIMSLCINNIAYFTINDLFLGINWTLLDLLIGEVHGNLPRNTIRFIILDKNFDIFIDFIEKLIKMYGNLIIDLEFLIDEKNYNKFPYLFI